MDTLYALPRDEAKQLFGCRTPESLQAYIAQLPASVSRLELAQGLELHQALTGGSEQTAGEYPLNHVVLGGRPLTSEPEFTVILKRPDMAGHIVTALEQVTLSAPELAPLLMQVVEFYRSAASSGSAVILVQQS